MNSQTPHPPHKVRVAMQRTAGTAAMIYNKRICHFCPCTSECVNTDPQRVLIGLAAKNFTAFGQSPVLPDDASRNHPVLLAVPRLVACLVQLDLFPERKLAFAAASIPAAETHTAP